MLSFFKFSQRLQYKCAARGVNLIVVDEHYTSKVCSACGNYKRELKGEKIYYCKKCKNTIDRDVNGCRNIIMKEIKE